MNKRKQKKIRYAVVGCGWISQAAALPAFKHASKNSELVALVSSDPKKLETLGDQYGVKHLYLADQYEECLQNPEVDAVYIALPNSMHADYAVRAAHYRKHVLCEKPLAVTSADCDRMVQACNENQVKLMTAYRLHFDPANLAAVEAIKKGKIGEPRLFSSVFTYNIKDRTNSRLKEELGGGPLGDIGIYCINAARYLFQAEPTTVRAHLAAGVGARFSEVGETAVVIMEFPNEVTAQFTCSFGAAGESSFDVIGAKGKLRLENAFEIFDERRLRITVGDNEEKVKIFKQSDQFAPEFIYFSDCVLKDKTPVPSGLEGRIDVHIIEQILRAIRTGRPVDIGAAPRKAKPDKRLQMKRPAFAEKKLIHANAPAA